MLEIIEKLLILQDRDRKIRQLEGELSRIEPERQTFRARAVHAQTSLDTAKARVKQLESERKALELEAETKRELIARYANQQLQTRKNEEYRALTHEIDTCKEEIRKIEDKELDLMEQAESTQKQVARETQAANEAKRMLEEQLAQLNAREQNLKNELAGVAGDREALVGAVEEGARNRYLRLTRSKGENVVVGVQHGVCGGCHMRLPAQVLVTCQAQQEMVTCTNCGRILYYAPGMDLAVAD